MRRPARSKTGGGRGQVSMSASLPAPVGGWNARDALGEMDAKDAITLTNWFPSTSDVVLRNGYTQFATGFGGQVESLMTYAGGSSEKLFAVANNSIYNATAGGAIGAADVTGLTNSRFQYTNVATAGGNFLLAVNGTDKLRGYSGAAWYTDGDGTHDITGVNTNTIIGLTLFKFRVWMVQKDTLNVWYLPTNAISGAATSFSLQGVAKEGGYIMAVESWTIDAGSGVDDLLVFVTSKGEVIVYKGTDPASATTWALVGVWRLGAPIGRRCLMKYAGDLLIICQDGLLALSSALQSSRVNPKVALSNKIQFATSESIGLYATNFGWDLLYYAKQNMLFLNVPVNTGGMQQQYVMNTITGAWCNFTGWNANCWEIFSDDPYFGGSGFIGRAWNGTSDAGSNVSADSKQAFNYFGSEGELKRWTMIRPILLSDGTPSIFADLNIDFDDYDTSSPLSFLPPSYGTWDASLWDSAIWGAGLTSLRQWQGANGVGYCAAVRLKTASSGLNVHWVSTDFVMERGGVL